jgi:hypothetical protein
MGVSRLSRNRKLASARSILRTVRHSDYSPDIGTTGIPVGGTWIIPRQAGMVPPAPTSAD